MEILTRKNKTTFPDTISHCPPDRKKTHKKIGKVLELKERIKEEEDE